eukprot:9632-Chlamydomonas_euryale.AAC.1
MQLFRRKIVSEDNTTRPSASPPPLTHPDLPTLVFPPHPAGVATPPSLPPHTLISTHWSSHTRLPTLSRRRPAWRRAACPARGRRVRRGKPPYASQPAC